MAPPVTRSKGRTLTDTEMRDVQSAGPDAPLETARAQARAAMPRALSGLQGLSQEIHDKIAEKLSPRDKANLAGTSRTLRMAYTPHVNADVVLYEVKRPSYWVPAPLFNRRSGKSWQTGCGGATDAEIKQRLHALLGAAPQDGDVAAQSRLSNMPVDARTHALIDILQNASAENTELCQTAFTLARPHVLTLPASHRNLLISDISATVSGSVSDAPVTRLCLYILEKTGARGNGAVLAGLASYVRLHFRDDEECAQNFFRFEALARELHREDDPAGHSVRRSLASIYQTMPDVLDAARLLFAGVASRPERERKEIYSLLAKGRAMVIGRPSRKALSEEQQNELKGMLAAEAASLPEEMQELILKAWG